MNDTSASYAELPRTAYFTHTLRRARNAAEQRSHRYVTLEHLLFALLDDPDALALLRAVGADVASIHSAISDVINHRMAASVVPDGRPPSFSYKFDSMMHSATEDAMRLRRREIDGALALIAVAKDRESNASAFLAPNGFSAGAALKALAAPQAPEERGAPPAPKPAQAGRQSRGGGGLPNAKQSGSPASSGREADGAPALDLDGSLEDMLESVRGYLDAEEHAAEAPAGPDSGAARRPQAGPEPSRRQEPRLDMAVGRERSPIRPVLNPQAGGQAAGPARAEPRFAHQPPPANAPPPPPPPPPPSRALVVRPAPNAPLPPANKEARGKGKRKRGQEQISVAARKLLDALPRRLRVGVMEPVEVLISKEECVSLFAGAKGRGQPLPQDASVSRAITVRLTAPEGGFIVEAHAAETQWLFDRPSFLDGEAFGRWVWTLIPNERGAHKLLLRISARNIDEHGMTRDAATPQQPIEVRVRMNYGGFIGRLLKTLFLLAAGSLITMGAYLALKHLGKLPHWAM